MARKRRVLVLCGGKSAEHQVSLVSAKTVLDNLDPKKYEAELVYIDGAGRWLSAEPKRLTGKVETKRAAIAAKDGALVPTERLEKAGRAADVVFPVLHGPLGEDGTVQGLFELAGVPYVGCGVLGSSVGMDKEFTKLLALKAGLPVLPWAAVTTAAQGRKDAVSLGFPLFVKPARLGSSVGVGKVKSPSDLDKALKTAFEYDDKVILEKGIAAREIECAVLGDPASEDSNDPLRLQASLVGEIRPNAEFYDYKAKYLDPEGAALDIPAKIPAETARKVQELALSAFRALDGYGMGRVDFLMDKETGEVWFNEMNTIPGFTPASMYPLLWKASGLPTPKLLDALIALALRRRDRRAKLKTTP